MDMIYHLPFRDWMQLDTAPSQSNAENDSETSDSGDGGR
jgi:hypothetical protein